MFTAGALRPRACDPSCWFMRTSLISVVLAAGCTGSASNATLADLPNAKVAVQSWAPSDTHPTQGFVTVGYDTTAFRAAHGGDCAAVDLDGTLNGASLDSDPGGGPDDLDDCSFPAFALMTDLSGPQTFRISDATAAITATYAADVFTPHRPELLSSAQWTMAAGDHVEVAWSAPDDLAHLAPEPLQVYFSTGKTDGNNAIDFTPAFSGDKITWTMPSPLSITGAGYLVFRFGYSTGVATACEGAAQCAYSAERGYAHSVTLSP